MGETVKFRIETQFNGRKPWPWTWLLYVDGDPIHVTLGVSRSERKAKKDGEKAAKTYATGNSYDYEVR